MVTIYPTVDKDTVSQYIGLRRYNGDMIFEGDIIESLMVIDILLKYDDKSASFRAILTTDKLFVCNWPAMD